MRGWHTSNAKACHKEKLWLVLMCKVCIARTWVVQKCCPSIRRQQESLQFFTTHIFGRNNGCVSPHCGFSRLFWCQALPLCHPLFLQCHSARITTICYGSNPWYSAEHLTANRCSTLKCGKLNAISRPQYDHFYGCHKPSPHGLSISTHGCHFGTDPQCLTEHSRETKRIWPNTARWCPQDT